MGIQNCPSTGKTRPWPRAVPDHGQAPTMGMDSTQAWMNCQTAKQQTAMLEPLDPCTAKWHQAHPSDAACQRAMLLGERAAQPAKWQLANVQHLLLFYSFTIFRQQPYN